ncbi:hypothetical protein QWY31_12170 [Cytophagales bacterium LB-30]|uniref:DUF2919 domain-containing protein n=1 Tax=Shiella aurantiaca TaxID=3058365 RepID=A0ABT8F6Z2_9BACT|nr:hypothetical protein [Shiella aurantiaca]MDN4166261.1 hypothetical protein [Shiella aurantiaca]
MNNSLKSFLSALTNAQLMPHASRKLVWVLFPLPFFALLLSRFAFAVELNGQEIQTLFHFCWMFAWAILVFSKGKVEDEMISQLRSKAFMAGVYFLLCGYLALFIISWVRNSAIASFNTPSVAIIDLLFFYIWASYRILLYLYRHEE